MRSSSPTPRGRRPGGATRCATDSAGSAVRRSSGVRVDHVPTTGLDLALELRRAPARVPGEDPHRFEVGAGVVRVATEVDGTDATESGCHPSRRRGRSPTTDARARSPHRAAAPDHRRRRLPARPRTAPTRRARRRCALGRLVEHDAERALVGVLDHEHDRPEEVGVVQRRHRDQQLVPGRVHHAVLLRDPVAAGPRRSAARAASSGSSLCSNSRTVPITSVAARWSRRRGEQLGEGRGGVIVDRHGPDTLNRPYDRDVLRRLGNRVEDGDG